MRTVTSVLVVIAVAAASVAGAAIARGCGDNVHREQPWGIGVHTFDAGAFQLGYGGGSAVAPWVAALADTTHLHTPTYDHSDQATHPDVLVEPDPRGGDLVMLALTPYPFTNDHFENPSLDVSRDGVVFFPQAGAPAPLVPPPPVDHNNDPDLRRDPTSGLYELLYLETERPAKQTLVALRSSDRATWVRRDAIVYDLAHGAPFIVSPAAVIDTAGATRLFYVDTGAGLIATLTSADGATWDQTQARPLALPMGDVQPWHIDVFPAGPAGTYAMLISGFHKTGGAFAHQDLYLATSTDPALMTWTLRPDPILRHDDPAIDVSTLYRSTGYVSGNRLVVYFSMQYWE